MRNVVVGNSGCLRNFELQRISLDTRTFMIIAEIKNTELDKNHPSPRYIPLSNLSLDYCVCIEQLFPEINKILDLYIKERKREIKNVNKFVEYCKKEFENQLVLEELAGNEIGRK
jgi:hypothetical protein